MVFTRFLVTFSLFVSASLGAGTTQVDLLADGSSLGSVADTDLSGDGRIAVLRSSSIVITPDLNGASDIFARDLQTGAWELVSVAMNGKVGNKASLETSVSFDGRYVAFSSAASDLVPNDFNGRNDIFVRDRVLGVTERVSVGTGGFSQGDWDSSNPCISADGRYVAFSSASSTLVFPDDSASPDVYVHDRLTKVTERVNVTPAGVNLPGTAGQPSLSADGRYVGFLSSEGLIPPKPASYSEYMVKDRFTGAVVRASVNAAGEPANKGCVEGSLSPDGRYALFATAASNLFALDTNGKIDVFLRDLVLGVTEAISTTPTGTFPLSESHLPFNVGNAISADGRFVVFSSLSTQIVYGVNGFGGALLRDRATQTTSRVAFTPNGGTPDGAVFAVAMSWDAARLLLESYAKNLLPIPTNGSTHAFLRDRTGFETLGGGITGTGGAVPALTGSGLLAIGGSGSLTLGGASANVPTLWIVSLAFDPTPFFGGVLAAHPPFQIQIGMTDAFGSDAMPWTIPTIPLLATEAFMQVAVSDGAAISGVALSNVLRLGFQ